MITNLLKISALIVTGRFLKPRLKGLIVLIIFWLIVKFLHSEYISYVELSDNTNFLWQISLLKITLYIIGLTFYILIIERKILLNEKKQIDLEKAQNNENEKAKDDGFNFLRGKKKLSTESEQLLKK